MRTELIWDGKYEDEARMKRRAPLRVALPFQTVETINESSASSAAQTGSATLCPMTVSKSQPIK